MSAARIAFRYGKSLIDLAIEQNKLERIHDDIESFRKAASNRDFNLLLKSPIINAGKKAQIFKVLFGGKYDEITVAFLNIILKKGREALLPDIAFEFVKQYKKIKNISTARLITAKSLDKSAIEKIRKKLKESPATNENIEIETKIDPEIIGGFVLEIDDLLYDASVARKLEQLKKEFRKNEFTKKL